METVYFVGFLSGFVVLLLLLALFFFVLLARVQGLEDALDEAEQSLPPKKLEEALAIAEGTSVRVDTAVRELEKYRDGVHSEVQRLYAVMRRQEKSAERLEAAQVEREAEEVPDEIDPANLGQTETQSTGVLSKAELRKRAREKGIQI